MTNQSTPNHTSKLFRELQWDSQFFNCKVAAISEKCHQPSDVLSALNWLKQNNYKIVYWASPHSPAVTNEIASKFSGTSVGCQVLYQRTITEQMSFFTTPSIVEHPNGPPTSQVIELGIGSGQFSRFANDPKISVSKFEEFYRLWIEGCIDGRLADSVILSTQDGFEQGMICVKQHLNEAKIVLISVDKSAQNLGIGAQLVTASLEFARRAGNSRSSVITYAENGAACRMFEKCGYQAIHRRNYVHFWF